MDYKHKYLKYKIKYLELHKQMGGGKFSTEQINNAKTKLKYILKKEIKSATGTIIKKKLQYTNDQINNFIKYLDDKNYTYTDFENLLLIINTGIDIELNDYNYDSYFHQGKAIENIDMIIGLTTEEVNDKIKIFNQLKELYSYTQKDFKGLIYISFNIKQEDIPKLKTFLDTKKYTLIQAYSLLKLSDEQLKIMSDLETKNNFQSKNAFKISKLDEKKRKIIIELFQKYNIDQNILFNIIEKIFENKNEDQKEDQQEDEKEKKIKNFVTLIELLHPHTTQNNNNYAQYAYLGAHELSGDENNGQIKIMIFLIKENPKNPEQAYYIAYKFKYN